MGKGIWILVLMFVMVVAGIANATISVEEYNDNGVRIAYLQNGKISVSDLDGKNKEVLIDLKDEKIRYFYVSPGRVNLALVTESEEVYFFDGKQSKKILAGKGDVTNVVFVSNSDMAISTICGQAINDLGESNPLIIHYLYIDGKVKEMSLSHDERIMVAGKDTVAVFNQSGMLKGSFSTFSVRTGRGKRILTPDAENAYFPEISPDGKYLAYYFKDESKEAKGGMGIKVYDLTNKKEVVNQSPVYSYPSSFGPEPAVWSDGKLIIHICFYAGDVVKNSMMYIDPVDCRFLHESRYSTKGQYDFLVEDAYGGDALFLHRESEKKKYNLYLVPVKGCSEDRIEVAANVTVARFITRR